MTDTLGKKVVQFLHFRVVESTFGYLQLILAEKNGFEVPNNKFHFQYILPSIFSQDPLEKCLGQARQRCGGNYYIDIEM